MNSDAPQAPAGWYPHPDMVDTVRYWDGSAWTGQVSPAPTAPTPVSTAADDEKVPCAYCGESMKWGMSKCPHCSGEYFFCKTEKKLMPVNTKMKFVGIARGGTKPSHKCRGCGRTLAGAKW